MPGNRCSIAVERIPQVCLARNNNRESIGRSVALFQSASSIPPLSESVNSEATEVRILSLIVPPEGGRNESKVKLFPPTSPLFYSLIAPFLPLRSHPLAVPRRIQAVRTVGYALYLLGETDSFLVTTISSSIGAWIAMKNPCHASV